MPSADRGLHRTGKSVHSARSWWGWGWNRAAVTPQEGAGLLDRVAVLNVGAPLTAHEPPAPESLGVSEPSVSLPDSLSGLGSTNLVDRLAHARGKAYRDVVRNLEGAPGRVPDIVARPADERDVARLLDWAGDRDVAVIPYGGGSSVTGGVEPRFDGHAGVLSLDLERLSRVVEVDTVSRAARIEGGVYGPHLEGQLREHALTLRHFPQSFEFSTLGGWLATRASGHFATLHTHIDDLTESLRVVTPQGFSESRRVPGSGAGPSPDRLFLGSEGTLGIITSAWMRLQDRPSHRAQAAVHFADFGEAVEGTRAIAQSGLHPTNCRLLDPAEATINTGATGQSVLVLGFESADHPVDAWLARALEIARDHHGDVVTPTATQDLPASPGQDPSATWRSSFIRMPYQRDFLARHGMIAETLETACTWAGFARLHADLTATATRVLQEVCGVGILTCRFTHVYPDGPAPYYGIYAPGRWGSLVQQWDEIKSALSDVIAAHDATITHHHSVGRDHRPWYDRQRSEPFALALRAAKDALDPAGILNPGVLLPRSTE